MGNRIENSVWRYKYAITADGDPYADDTILRVDAFSGTHFDQG